MIDRTKLRKDWAQTDQCCMWMLQLAKGLLHILHSTMEYCLLCDTPALHPKSPSCLQLPIRRCKSLRSPLPALNESCCRCGLFMFSIVNLRECIRKSATGQDTLEMLGHLISFGIKCLCFHLLILTPVTPRACVTNFDTWLEALHRRPSTCIKALA